MALGDKGPDLVEIRVCDLTRGLEKVLLVVFFCRILW